MSRIVNYIKRKLGVTELEKKLETERNQLIKAESKLRVLTEKHSDLQKFCSEVSKDNRVIMRHLSFLNSEFSVASDISPTGYDPSVVIIMRKGNEDVVKTYEFKEGTVQEIYHILEGFGRENNRIDKPRHMPSPRFRW